MVCKKTFLTAAGLIALSASNSNAMMGDEAGMEKCYGVVKAGHNDCGNAQGTHSCAGQAQHDADPGEWVSLPEGTCERIVGGSTTPKI